jgi:dynein heavy chain
MLTSAVKPLHKIISDHKDVVKIVIQLNSIISTFKIDVNEVLENFVRYSHLWDKVRFKSK